MSSPGITQTQITKDEWERKRVEKAKEYAEKIYDTEKGKVPWWGKLHYETGFLNNDSLDVKKPDWLLYREEAYRKSVAEEQARAKARRWR